MTIKFYRYEIKEYANVNWDGDFVRSAFPNPKIELNIFSLVKETPKGYWISFGSFGGLKSESRWVSKTSKKRYAYPTKEEALQNLIKRNECRIKILKWQLDVCRIVVNDAKKMLEEINLVVK